MKKKQQQRLNENQQFTLFFTIGNNKIRDNILIQTFSGEVQ